MPDTPQAVSSHLDDAVRGPAEDILCYWHDLPSSTLQTPNPCQHARAMRQAAPDNGCLFAGLQAFEGAIDSGTSTVLANGASSRDAAAYNETAARRQQRPWAPEPQASALPLSGQEVLEEVVRAVRLPRP